MVIALVVITAAGCGGSSSKASQRDDRRHEAERQGMLAGHGLDPGGTCDVQRLERGLVEVTEFELKNDKGIILGERENIVEGIDGSFSLTQPGTYVLSCPNGDPHDVGVLTATGKRAIATVTASAAVLARATTGLPRLRREPVDEAARGHEDVRRRDRTRRPTRSPTGSTRRPASSTAACSSSRSSVIPHAQFADAAAPARDIGRAQRVHPAHDERAVRSPTRRAARRLRGK